MFFRKIIFPVQFGFNKLRFFRIFLIISGLQVLCAIPVCCSAETIYVSAVVNNSAYEIRSMLQKVMPENVPVVYTVVPRGLIVSIKEDIFFRGNNILLNKSSAAVLNAMVTVLAAIGNNCTIESHTEGHDNQDGIYRSNWEISMARADAIADYLIYCGNIPVSRIFALGFGDCMPFRDNVSALKKGFDRRVDFVIFSYEYKR